MSVAAYPIRMYFLESSLSNTTKVAFLVFLENSKTVSNISNTFLTQPSSLNYFYFGPQVHVKSQILFGYTEVNGPVGNAVNLSDFGHP